jgi:hypothetical protein
MAHTNKLIDEKSPYLLQHAHNPVDWLPWGEEAFEQARVEDKPIFLSIGYSTCHWCHVMERESFENEAVADLMNRNFINVKVDREERPDVDRMYMTFVQATTGSGGWPLSVFLTPDLKPFYGGTYFPPEDAYGRMGFSSLLQRIREAWDTDRDKVETSGSNVLESLEQYATVGGHGHGHEISWDDIIDGCYSYFKQSYDKRWGGFGDAPKFPRPVTHDFLHRYYAWSGEQDAVQMSGFTLLAMANGGMNDQLGGGFHRYSVDERWIVSHFEKMLYDQAQLVNSYLEMYQLTREPIFAETARGMLDYVLRDMTHPAGGFYAAEDADSLPSADTQHKEEGAFYVWTTAEVEQALGAERAAIFNDYYGLRPAGNAPPQGDPHGEFKGKNILYRAQPIDEVAQRQGRTTAEVEAELQAAQTALLAIREQRPRPHRDEKIIVAWNGLMTAAFARAAQVLDEPRYLAAAERAAAFIQTELWDAANGTLQRHWRDGAAGVAAFADDYAALIGGLLDLFEASFDVKYLQWAELLTDTLNRDYWDEESGGYFNALADPHVLLRLKEDYDGAEPSANSVATLNNLRLAQLLDRDDLRQRAEATLELFADRLHHAAPAMPTMIAARMMASTAPLHIVIVGDKAAAATQKMLQAVRERFIPYKNVVRLSGDATQEYLAARLPFLAAMQALDNRPTAYLCRNFACRQPVTTVEELVAQLES